ncbi:hypothetical protein ACIQZO_35020 [Streptomyces sp. NPDC097617]|uniref:hypothetical protein n=1 Tax=Streptomyces sp. NPDC097617 TaxID=3366091 RepID=UPI003803BF2F
MPNSTDLNALDVAEAAPRVLLAVAEHFTEVNPTEELEQHLLLLAIGAEAYELSDRSLSGGADKLARAAFALAPELRQDITRGEYALLARGVLAEAGHEWTEDDNAPAIPRITGIPGPRREPVPTKRPSVPTQPTSKAAR